jgi:hypothetical protein
MSGRSIETPYKGLKSLTNFNSPDRDLTAKPAHMVTGDSYHADFDQTGAQASE